MEKKFEIYTFEYWMYRGGLESNPIALKKTLEHLDVPLFNSEAEALKWYDDTYKAEQEKIDKENSNKPKGFLGSLSSPKTNKLPKQIYLRECWVIE